MVNRVTIVGRLTRDPEVHDTASGGKLANMRLVTTDFRRGENGQKEEEVQYHSIVAIGRLGEICADYLSKGRLVFFEGKLRTREWEGKDGLHRYTTEVLADRMVMLSPKTGGEVEQPGSVEPAGVMAGAGAI